MNWIKKQWTVIKAEPKTVREFGFILAGFFLLFPLLTKLLGVWLAHRKFYYWYGWLIFALATFAVNLMLPRAMSFVYRSAMLVAHGISWVVMRVVLGVFFYVIISPISITMRLLGKDLLDEKLEPTRCSYWRPRPKKEGKEHYQRLF